MNEPEDKAGQRSLAWLTEAIADLFDRYATEIGRINGLDARWQATPPGLTRTLLCFRVASAGMREAIELACRSANIETRRWYLPLIQQHDGFTELPVIGQMRCAGQVAQDLVGLPFHNHFGPDDIARICAAIAGAIGPR